MRLPLHIRLLLQRFFYAFIFFTLARLLFFVLNAGTFAPSGFAQVLSTFVYGLLFDLSAIAYVNSLFYLLSALPLPVHRHERFQRALKILFVVTNGLALLLNLVDTEYFKFAGKRTGMELFLGDNEIGKLAGSYLLDYWYLLLAWLALLWFMWKFYPETHKREEHPRTARTYAIQSGWLVLLAGLWVIGARGGFYLKPIRPFDASRFVAAELIPLTINTPLQLFSTIGSKPVKVPDYMPPAQAEKIYPYLKQYTSGPWRDKKNVVLIILESFGKEYVGCFNPESKLTPFLDSLCRKGLLFTHCYANGKKSIEALPSILSSLPSLLDVPFINSPYQSNKLTGLGRILKEEGYSTAFYHGAKNGTMGFDGFVGASQFGSYYGLNEYPGNTAADQSGPWGIDDEPYLQYVAAQLRSMPKPFCAAVFTLSSHHPYAIPARYSNLPKGSLPIHQSVAYTDMSLRRFFETVSREPWYRNTVFVLTADHSAQNQLPLYQTMAGKFEVPLLIYDPIAPEHNPIGTTCGHTDIMPTLLDYLGYDKAVPGFGQSALRSDSMGCVVLYENGFCQIIRWPWVLHFNGQKSTALFNLQSDPLMKQNLLTPANTPPIPEMEKTLKAIIQQYMQRLSENKLAETSVSSVPATAH